MTRHPSHPSDETDLQPQRVTRSETLLTSTPDKSVLSNCDVCPVPGTDLKLDGNNCLEWLVQDLGLIWLLYSRLVIDCQDERILG